MDFTIKPDKVKGFKNTINAVAVLIDEGVLNVNKEGLNVQAMDSSQIAMVILKMPDNAFESFNFTEDLNVGVNFEELNKIIKRANNEDVIKIEIGNTLKIKFIGKSTRTFNLSIIDGGGGKNKVPEIEYNSKVVVSAGDLREGLSDAGLMGTHVKMTVDGKFILNVEGDVGSSAIDFPEELAVVESSKNEFAIFDLEMLGKLLKSAESSTEVTLNLRTAAPILINYSIGESEVKYYLAPRIESE